VTTRLEEVAELAGVSRASASRVLNGRSGTSARTRDAVLTALDVLGYRRPAAARAEPGSLIGLVVPDLRNPIFPAFADLIAAALVRRGLVPLLCTRTADGVSEADHIEMLLAHGTGGVIFIGGSLADAGPEHRRTLTERGLPVVLVNAADDHPGAATVAVDDAAAVDKALAHLADLGHRRIGLVAGPDGHAPSDRKVAAFAARLPHMPVGHAMFTAEGGRATAARLLDAQVTGLVCASDALALGAIRAVRRRGLEVPRDVSVIGFDDSAHMPVTDPPLTTLRQPVAAIAAAAVAALTTRIATGPAGHGGQAGGLVFEPELIVRETTGPPPRKA